MKTIAIISQKGGACKTTIAVHLAVAATQSRYVTLLVDTDPQATASNWSSWRGDEAPEVIDCASHALLPRKLEKAAALGAELVIIDTPPHADIMAREACKLADLLLIPCRPRAFDLDAVSTTAELARASGKKAFLLFSAGPVRAPQMYTQARQLVKELGISVAPVMLTERAAYHHSVGAGKTALETEPKGKAAEEVVALFRWLTEQLDLSRPSNRSTRPRVDRKKTVLV